MKELSRPVVPLQQEPAECGLVCLRAAVAVHGRHLDTNALKNQGYVSVRGLKLSDILRICADVGIEAQAVAFNRLSIPEFRRNTILLVDRNHFVLVGRLRRARVEIFDPSNGWSWTTKTALYKRIDGLGVEIGKPSALLPPRPAIQSGNISRWLAAQHTAARALIGPAAIGLLSIGIAALLPFIAKHAIDGALSGWNAKRTLSAGSVAFLSALVVALLAYFAAIVSKKTALKIDTTLTADLLRRLFRLPLAFFSRQHSLLIASRIGVVAELRRTMTQYASELLGAVLLGILAFFFLLRISTLIAFATLAAGIFLSLQGIFQQREHRNRVIAAGLVQREYSVMLNEIIECAPIFRLAGVQHAARERLQKSYECMTAQQTNVDALAARQALATSVSSAVSTTLALVAGVYLLSNERITIGDFFACSAYSAMVGAALGALGRIIDVRSTLAAAEGRIEALLEHEVDDINPATCELAGRTTNLINDVEFDSVSYQYSKFDEPIFKDLSFCIAAGECVAIKGPSGSGKSTLAKLMAGVVTPTEGSVKVVGNLSTGALSGLAIVRQDDRLITGSIYENISIYRQHSRDSVIQAAKLAGIDEFVSALPMRYETVVSDAFTGLSGGQRQRIILARAILGSPRLLIMDEATSALDPAMERFILANLKQMKMTLVMFTHRFESIRAADRVIDVADLLRRTPFQRATNTAA